MTVNGLKVGYALTGSFCTFSNTFLEMERLAKEEVDLYPIFSERSCTIDSRFGKAEDFLKKAEAITGKKPVTTIETAEKFGPGNILDIVVIAPCTGNTMAKLAYGITDSPVLMAAKGHLRNNKPVVLAIATNDALGANMKNIGMLMNTKNIYFVPFSQDNYEKKPFSMIAHFNLLLPTIIEALQGNQLQPVILAPK
ncbi:dipicolinate synthase subunit B [Mobilitalea sibirica]|uniref:Dipicolinate synthase subunit B n=1 Tax=Mobilitalea sibirica TaxID=1462919 RepID=A0A8J7L1W1_9FIRM|nr:dipicolinate synthase subunit B [Mobilitalea sibirica]MBH1939353.1 dipicolinate synthase subunit B [Mobilitalea sibirica]